MTNVVISRVFDIIEINKSLSVNAPYRIELANGNVLEDGYLVFNDSSLRRHKIPFSLDLVSRKLLVKLESIQLPLDESGESIEALSEGKDLLEIKKLTKGRSIIFIYPEKKVSVKRIMDLKTLGYPLKGMGLSALPCPLFELTLSLQAREYLECSILPALSVFSISFALLE